MLTGPPWGGAVPASSSRLAPSAGRTARPLVVSTDEDLVDDLLRLLAAAGAEAELATGGPALRRARRAAPPLLVGAAGLPTAPLPAPPRRPRGGAVGGTELPPSHSGAAPGVGG